MRRALKPAVFVASCLPMAYLAWAALAYGLSFNPILGANPIEAITRSLGDWALRFLLITLTLTPLVKGAKFADLARLRRMIGLFAFAYAVLHLASYVVLDQFFDWHQIGRDILKRNFITVGMAAVVVMIPLAVTSTNGWIKRMGFRKWKKLHRLVYVAGIGGALHYYWMVKADLREPLIYAAFLAFLLGWRAWMRWKPAR